MPIHWEKVEPPSRLANLLWTADAQALPARRFNRLACKVLRSTNHWWARWRLGGAINDYLRFHPDAFVPPLKLTRDLMRSKNSDARLIGVKLARYCMTQEEDYIVVLEGALCDKSPSVRCTAVHEIVEYFWEPSKLQNPQRWIGRIGPKLHHIARHDRENANRNIADQYLVYWRNSGWL